MALFIWFSESRVFGEAHFGPHSDYFEHQLHQGGNKKLLISKHRSPSLGSD